MISEQADWDLRIRAFRACDDKEARDKYHFGLEQILSYYGITRVTSQRTDWFDIDDTWLLVIENPKDKQILGGARLQKAVPNFQLPIERAISYKDSSIIQIVHDYYNIGVGELCGLWNSRKVAGLGLGSIFLGRAAVAYSNTIGLNKLLALCSPATKQHCLDVGFDIDRRFGKQGEFIYPKENLVATTLIIEDSLHIPLAKQADKKYIFDLRENKNAIKTEVTLKGELKLSYFL